MHECCCYALHRVFAGMYASHAPMHPCSHAHAPTHLCLEREWVRPGKEGLELHAGAEGRLEGMAEEIHHCASISISTVQQCRVETRQAVDLPRDLDGLAMRQGGASHAHLQSARLGRSQ
jgi:hypothetical protein